MLAHRWSTLHDTRSLVTSETDPLGNRVSSLERPRLPGRPHRHARQPPEPDFQRRHRPRGPVDEIGNGVSQ